MCSRPVLLLGKYNSRFRPLWHQLRPVLLLELDTMSSTPSALTSTALELLVNTDTDQCMTQMHSFPQKTYQSQIRNLRLANWLPCKGTINRLRLGPICQYGA